MIIKNVENANKYNISKNINKYNHKYIIIKAIKRKDIGIEWDIGRSNVF